MRLFSTKNINSNNLKAVYEDDLLGYLKSIGIYSDIESGKILCKYCGNKITFENLEVIVPTENGVAVVCNNKNCLNQM